MPPGWTCSILREATPGRDGADSRDPNTFIEVVAPDDSRSTILVAVKGKLDPKDVPDVVGRARDQGPQLVVVAAPYLSPRTRERLVELGAGYVDSTGNLRMAMDRPALFIETTGAQASPWPEGRPLRSLKGPAAGRVVRALCDFKPPYGIRQLADRGGISAATATRVVEFLDREAIVQREPRGPVLAVDWNALIRRWTQDYSLTESNRTATFLEPRGLPALLERLRGWRSYALTGSAAASSVAPAAPVRLAVVYVPSIGEAADFLGLREIDAGANVLLAEPFDPIAMERTQQRDGLNTAALSQVAADLLTSPGRGPSEAEELIRWMSEHEDAWRS